MAAAAPVAAPVTAAEPEPAPEPDPPPPSAKPAPPPEPAPPEPTALEKQLALARAALAEERWAEATTAARAAQRLEPRNADAEAILKAARVEPQNKRLFDELMKAAEEGDPDKTTRRWRRIPEDSLYHPRAKAAYEQVKKDYLHVKRAEATALAETRMCARIAPIEKQVKGFFPESAEEIAAIGRKCAAQ
jgi:hypothetical protein